MRASIGLKSVVLGIFLSLGAGTAQANHTVPGDSVTAMRDCIERMTAGVDYNSDGSRYTHSDTSKFPRYPQEIAMRVCGLNPTSWRSSLNCMDGMTAGVGFNSDGSRYVHSDIGKFPRYPAMGVWYLCSQPSTTPDVTRCIDRMTSGVGFNSDGSRYVHSDHNRFPRYPLVDSIYLCRNSQPNWNNAVNCVDHVTGGVQFNSDGSRWLPSDPSRYPRYGISAGARVCAHNPTPQGIGCVANLVSAGIADAAAGFLCARAATPEAQQCLVRFKIFGMGLIPDFLAAKQCVRFPNSQPSDASRIAACLNPNPTGQIGYNGAGAGPSGDDDLGPPLPPVSPTAAPANQ